MPSFNLIRTILSLSGFFASVLGAQYVQSDSHQGVGFLKSFQHQTLQDPTNGRVNYVDEDTALEKNLTFYSGDHFVIRADHTTKLSASGPGRDSVRLQSNKRYKTHVTVWNIRHMPVGCGTWPAIWEVGDNWPNEGEIDILEGVDGVSPNQATLHTSSGCTMPASRSQTGTVATGNNCDTAATGNAGCGVKAPSEDSYGAAFNSAGGGWYAMERTNSFIKVWFWSRGADNVPRDVENGAASISTDDWGTPFAYFPSQTCDIADHFGEHNLVINLTLCGDWAGASNVYSASGCPSDCVSYVNDNPSAFTDAYFDVEWLKIYQ